MAYTARMTDYLHQAHTGAKLMVEYLKRLKAVGIEPYGEGVYFDEIICTPEQGILAARIFRELCEDLKKMKED